MFKNIFKNVHNDNIKLRKDSIFKTGLLFNWYRFSIKIFTRIVELANNITLNSQNSYEIGIIDIYVLLINGKILHCTSFNIGQVTYW